MDPGIQYQRNDTTHTSRRFMNRKPRIVEWLTWSLMVVAKHVANHRLLWLQLPWQRVALCEWFCTIWFRQKPKSYTIAKYSKWSNAV